MNRVVRAIVAIEANKKVAIITNNPEKFWDDLLAQGIFRAIYVVKISRMDKKIYLDNGCVLSIMSPSQLSDRHFFDVEMVITPIDMEDFVISCLFNSSDKYWIDCE